MIVVFLDSYDSCQDYNSLILILLGATNLDFYYQFILVFDCFFNTRYIGVKVGSLSISNIINLSPLFGREVFF